MSMPKMRILKISRVNILFTKRRHSTSKCLSAFPMENITSTHLVIVHNKEMPLRKSYKRSSIYAELLAYKAKATVPNNGIYRNKPLEDENHTP